MALTHWKKYLMATQQHLESNVEAAILARSIHPERDDLSQEAAEALLHIGLDREDLARIHMLVTKNQDDALTPAEKADLESYLRVSAFFDLMHAKARRSLKKHS
jgi:hypothetical protein